MAGLIFSLLGLLLSALLRSFPAVGLLVLVVGPGGVLYLVVLLLWIAGSCVIMLLGLLVQCVVGRPGLFAC